MNEKELEEHIEFINEIKSQCITGLVKKYLLTAQEVRDNKDKTPETRRENLRKLLEPIIWLNKFIHGKDNPYRINFPAWEGRPYNRSFYPFINEDIIDLDNEIDVSKLKKNPQKYHIYYNGNIINMRHDKISFPTRSESLLAEYYDKWILKITPETMRANVDLLDNVLFVYAIKRALNGDEQTIEKLYSTYESMIQAEAIKIAIEWKISKRDFKYIKNDSKFILRHIISGLTPETLIADLQKEKRDKSLLTPKWAEKFYIWYFSEYLPPLLHEGVELFEKNPEDLLLQQTIINCLSPYMAINALTVWKSKKSKRIFNSYSFRPTKKSNLTRWIISSKKKPMLGKFRQLIKPLLKEYILGERYDDNKEYKKNQTKQIDSSVADTNEMIDLLIEKTKTTRRNAEIYIKYKVFKEKQGKIGEDYSLSRKQINRIVKEIDAKAKK